jgi:phycoerythrin-associated linker protein
MKFPMSDLPTTLEQVEANMLPPEAQKRMQGWIRSRHLICSGNFFVFETVDYSAVDRFSDCVAALGGTVITVEPVDKIWMGDHRQVLLYRSRASLHAPCHTLKQYWLKYGSFRTRFDGQV